MTEIPIQFFLITLWWIASLTILLPLVLLLKYSKYFRDLWFPFFFTKLLYFYEYQATPLRRQQFELLKKKLSGRDNSKPLKILEIGFGSGTNLPFYPENCHLTALDMNANFEAYFKENRKKYPHITYERTVIGVAENMRGIDDCTFDVVVTTFVLCSVNSPKDALKEIKRVLKPGGKYCFLEHVAYPKSRWGYTIQSYASPLWYIFFDHCNIQRNSGSTIEKAEFSHVDSEMIFPKPLHPIVGAMLIGIATK